MQGELDMWMFLTRNQGLRVHLKPHPLFMKDMLHHDFVLFALPACQSNLQRDGPPVSRFRACRGMESVGSELSHEQNNMARTKIL